MPENVRGLLERGNADLQDREEVPNPGEGGTSTVRSMSFNDGKHEVLIPTAADGKIYSDDDAIDRYRATGEHLGKFATPEAATAYAQGLHRSEERRLQRLKPPAPTMPVRNGPPVAEPEADLELDDNGKVITPHPALTWQNAGTELPNRMGDAMANHLPHLDHTQTELAIMRLRNEIDQKAIPAAAAARQAIPGMETLGRILTYRDRIPQDRQPVQMQREFSNDQEKEAYLERIRQAQRNAGRK